MDKYMPNGLHPGDEVLVRGMAFESGAQFSINLALGNTPDRDIALHFAVRINDDIVTRNSKLSGSWGAEERQMVYFPFRRGNHFKVKIQVEQTCFKISVDDKHFADFKHRIEDLPSIQWLWIKGECCVTEASASPYGYFTGPAQSNLSSLPDWTYFSRKLRPGSEILVRGFPASTCPWFTIDFTLSDAATRDIALHIKPRFDLDCVVRNTRISNTWGTDEREAGSIMPFHRGNHFKVLIRCKETYFKILVNDVHFCDYKYRVKDLGSIQWLIIGGDICVTENKYTP